MNVQLSAALFNRLYTHRAKKMKIVHESPDFLSSVYLKEGNRVMFIGK